MSGGVFRILSIDGGGIRGAFPAHILACIKHRLQINIEDHFNMIAGTSTGSIVAAAVACKIDPGEIVGLYRKHGPLIFKRKKSYLPDSWQPGRESIYRNENLEKVLKNRFGDIKLGEISIPLLIPATDGRWSGKVRQPEG